MIVAARPMLNATMRARPSPIRWSAIADRRTTSADGHGSNPAATPTPRIPFDVRASSFSHARDGDRESGRGHARAVVRGRGVAMSARAESQAKYGRSDQDDEQSRDERKPRVELLRDDEGGQAECHESECEHAGGMRDRDRSTEEERVARRPLRAHEVRRDHRLPVAGREGMRGAPERSDQEGHEEHAHREVALFDERLEAARRVPGRVERRRCSVRPRALTRERSSRAPTTRRAATGGDRSGTSGARRSHSQQRRSRQ